MFTHVAQLSELSSGTTKSVEIDGHKILLANVKGDVFAVYGKCSHYNLPLDNAALCEHRIRCPFHHACFDVRTGKQLEAPGTEGLASYAVKIEGDDIHVRIKDEKFTGLKPTATENSDTAICIIGGGIAAINAIIGLRETGYQGAIKLISKEATVPYDRTGLSKAYLQGDKPAEKLPIYPESWYGEQGVELIMNTEVLSVNVATKTIVTDSGERNYNKLLICTGGIPRRLNVPGADLNNVHVIRTLAQAERVVEATKNAKKAVVIGAGFIGMEVAMSLRNRNIAVTVVAPDTELFVKQWGERVGRLVRQLHEEAGVTFQLGHKVAALRGEASEVNHVELENGHTLAADLVVAGIGVTPATDFIDGLDKNKDGSLSADEHLSVAADVYAAGDLVEYPDPRAGRVRIEHWKVAAQQGRVAGRNLAGATEKYTMLPFFWSSQQGKNFRYAGHAKNWDTIEYAGNVEDRKFIATYLKDGKPLAYLGLGMDARLAHLAEKLIS